MHLLAPETLPLGDLRRWPAGPPIASFGWLSYNFFPRSAQAGTPPIPYADTVRPDDFFEVQTGCVRAESVAPDTPFIQRLDIGLAQASACGMRVKEVAANAALELIHLHPEQQTWKFVLPGKPPRMSLRLPDEAPVELVPTIRTVLLEPDKNRVCLVWVGEHRLSLPVGPGKMSKIQHAVVWR
jgi:hypothetical protein